MQQKLGWSQLKGLGKVQVLALVIYVDYYDNCVKLEGSGVGEGV